MAIPAALQDLMNRFTTPEDKAVFEQLVERNPDARQQAEAQATLYDAFVRGDESQLPKLGERTTGTGTGTGGGLSAGEIQLQLDLLMNKIDKRLSDEYIPKIDERIKSADAQAIMEKAAEKFFNSKAAEFEAGLLGKTIKGSDELIRIHRSHDREFGTELDTTKFEEFLNAPENAGKFPSMTKAHDAFVSEDRITKRVKDGIEEGVAARATANVPGTLSTLDTPLARMVQANAKVTGITDQPGSMTGDQKDAMVADFRKLMRA